MKVQIVKCSDRNFWYSHSKGSTLNVYEIESDGAYRLTNDEIDRIKHLFPNLLALYIQKSDCEVVEQ